MKQIRAGAFGREERGSPSEAAAPRGAWRKAACTLLARWGQWLSHQLVAIAAIALEVLYS